MIMVHAPGGKTTNVALAKVGDNYSLDFNKYGFLGHLRYLKFMKFCQKRGLEVTKEIWGKEKMFRAKYKLNEVEFIKVIKEYFFEVHGVENDQKIYIQYFGWSPPNKVKN